MTSVPTQLLLAYAPALAALAAAVAGALATRRRPAWALAAGAAAALLGWAALSGRAALWPRVAIDHLAGAALPIACAAALGTRLRGRAAAWAGFSAVALAGWWLAGSPAGRPEFWRVWFAVGALCWLLRRAGAGAARPAIAAGLTLSLGLAAAGAATAPIVAALVLAAAGLGVSAVKGGGLPAALVGLGVAATDLAAGRLVRGELGMIDLVCIAAALAAAGEGWVERRLQPRFGRLARVAGPAAAAAAGVATAWVAARALRP